MLLGISDDESGQAVEEKQDEKSNKNKFKKTLSIVAIVIIIVAAIVGIIVYIFSGDIGIGKNKPASALENFCAYFNSKNLSKMLDNVDTKGYYIFLSDLEQKDYPKYEKKYDEFDESIEDYKNYNAYLEECKQLDQEIIEIIMENVTLNVDEIISVTKIQGTKELYLVKAKIKIASGEESETVTESIYVSKINGEYKLVNGYLTDVLYSLLQNAYTYNYYYGSGNVSEN